MRHAREAWQCVCESSITSAIKEPPKQIFSDAVVVHALPEQSKNSPGLHDSPKEREKIKTEMSKTRTCISKLPFFVACYCLF